MRKALLYVAGAFVVLAAAFTWFLSGGPDSPADWVAEYGGSEGQYRVLIESDDCQHLGQTAANMDERFDREHDRVALGYQTAAVDRMDEISCP